jgi:hypothetical protein
MKMVLNQLVQCLPGFFVARHQFPVVHQGAVVRGV